MRELVGDSQREKGRKRQGMERVIDRERERENDGLKEEDMAERGTLKRDTHEGFQTERERQWQRGDRRSRNGRAMVEAR